MSRTPTVGAQLPGEDAEAALAVLSALPSRFPGRVLYATAEDGRASCSRSPTGPRSGSASRPMLARKLAAAAAVLRSLPEEERLPLGYLDASVLERVVAGPTLNPQVNLQT